MLKSTTQTRRRTFWVWLLVGSIAVAGLFYGLSWRYPRVLSGGDAQPHIVHYLILLVVLGSALMAGRETGTGAMLRHAAKWLAIGALAVLGYRYRADFLNLGNRIVSELRPDTALTTSEGDVAIHRRSDEHSRLTATVEGVRIRFLVGTGANLIALSPEDAQTIGFDINKLRYSLRIQTANGIARLAGVSLGEISVGTIHTRNVRAAARRTGLSKSLLGLTFLDPLSGYEVRGDTMVLKH